MSNNLIIKDDDKLYTLIKNDSNKYFINVVCGGIAMYEAKIKLTENEVEMFNKRGKSYMDELAYKISNNSEQYKKRMI